LTQIERDGDAALRLLAHHLHASLTFRL
jgi:hypothetical protein